MMYRMTVDYVTSTTVLVEADGTLEAERAVYAYLKTDEGLDCMLEAVHENPNRHWSAFEVAEAASAPHETEADIVAKEVAAW